MVSVLSKKNKTKKRDTIGNGKLLVPIRHASAFWTTLQVSFATLGHQNCITPSTLIHAPCQETYINKKKTKRPSLLLSHTINLNIPLLHFYYPLFRILSLLLPECLILMHLAMPPKACHSL